MNVILGMAPRWSCSEQCRSAQKQTEVRRTEKMKTHQEEDVKATETFTSVSSTSWLTFCTRAGRQRKEVENGMRKVMSTAHWTSDEEVGINEGSIVISEPDQEDLWIQLLRMLRIISTILNNVLTNLLSDHFSMRNLKFAKHLFSYSRLVYCTSFHSFLRDNFIFFISKLWSTLT